MKLTPQQVALIRATFALLEPKSGVAGLAFFQRLFALDPSLRALISGDIDAEADELMRLLRAVTTLADQPRALQVKFAREDMPLFKSGAWRDHRETVGEALLWSLGTTLGREFTPEARVAWVALMSAATENRPRA
jgi:hemoglobin-like flavoprotein